MKRRGMGLWVGAAVVSLGLAVLAGYRLGQQIPAQPVPQQAEIQTKQTPRKILYYRNPMGLPDTSPTPKKDSMGMDYIPVYADEESVAQQDHSGHGVTLSAGKIQKLGVKTVLVTRGAVDRVVRATGRVVVDERRVHVVAPRFEGYVERLWVNANGQRVSRDQPLFDVYAPELLSAQREYLLARQGVQAAQQGGEATQRGMQQLAEAALQRLRNWDVAQVQIQALEKTGVPQRALSVLSPVSGVVTEKKALAGQRFMPGDTLYQITDLSTVWLIAEVAEQDLAQIKLGLEATLSFAAWPDKTLTGRVSYIYPELNAATRSVSVRIELPNPDLQLKPDMYASVLWRTEPTRVLNVPTSAIIDSGTRQVVLVQTDAATGGSGHFEPRVVQLGQRGETTVAVVAGLHEGERVVVAANFLIDAESNLRAALNGLGGVKAMNAEVAETISTLPQPTHDASQTHAGHTLQHSGSKPAMTGTHEHDGHGH